MRKNLMECETRLEKISTYEKKNTLQDVRLRGKGWNGKCLLRRGTMLKIFTNVKKGGQKLQRRETLVNKILSDAMWKKFKET